MARIYLSSTYSDLKEHREAVYKALLRMGHVVLAMDDYVADDQRPVNRVLDEVASCDAFICIVAWSYGYIPERDDFYGLSITDLEYRHALNLKKPCFIFMLDADAPWPPSKRDESRRIEAFREELLHNHVVSFFKGPTDLAMAVVTAISSWDMARAAEPVEKSGSRAGSKRKRPGHKGAPDPSAEPGGAIEFDGGAVEFVDDDEETGGGGSNDSGGGGETPGGDPPRVPLKVPKVGVAKGASERNALNDKPQEDIEKDLLGFSDYVSALRDFVLSQDTTTPLTIGINGAWGSGKSSLMRMLQRELNREAPPMADGTDSAPPPSKLKWLAGYLVGTLVCWWGRLLTLRLAERNFHVHLGISFAPRSPITDAEFPALFHGHVMRFGAQAAEVFKRQGVALDFEGAEPKARWWARHAARRVKMVPWRYPTVWFNAWKFNQQEQVWSALALAVLGQMKNNYGFLARLRFLVQLTLKRADKMKVLTHALRKLAVPILLAAAVALYQFYVAPLLEPGKSLSERAPDFLKGLGRWPWVAPVAAAVWKAWREIEDPFKLPVEELAEAPDYREKVGFIATFEEDFGRIVEVAVRRSFFWQPRKLVVFIDDLDRCGPLQATSIIEAVNLFLDSVGCVFVLGMDMAAVSTSIEVKYRELAERMKQDAPDAASPGSLFLDKIVQVPFNVPRPNRDYIKRMVTAITSSAVAPPKAVEGGERIAPKPGDGNGAAPASPAGGLNLNVLNNTLLNPAARQADRASFEHKDIRNAIFFASPLLKENPRQVKRFINLFRLQVYIAETRAMLFESGLTPQALAVWVAWYMQWPQLLRALSDSPHTREIREHMTTLGESVEIKGEGADAKACLKGDALDAYLTRLKGTRESEKDTPSHWSKMPWHLWVRDADFLLCVKELEPYWESPRLLDSLLDMTQVAVTRTADPAAQTQTGPEQQQGPESKPEPKQNEAAAPQQLAI